MLKCGSGFRAAGVERHPGTWHREHQRLVAGIGAELQSGSVVEDPVHRNLTLVSAGDIATCGSRSPEMWNNFALPHSEKFSVKMKPIRMRPTGNRLPIKL